MCLRVSEFVLFILIRSSFISFAIDTCIVRMIIWQLNTLLAPTYQLEWNFFFFCSAFGQISCLKIAHKLIKFKWSAFQIILKRSRRSAFSYSVFFFFFFNDILTVYFYCVLIDWSMNRITRWISSFKNSQFA